MFDAPSILLLGLLRRQKHGIGKFGFESALVFCVYVGTGALNDFLSNRCRTPTAVEF